MKIKIYSKCIAVAMNKMHNKLGDCQYCVSVLVSHVNMIALLPLPSKKN